MLVYTSQTPSPESWALFSLSQFPRFVAFSGRPPFISREKQLGGRGGRFASQHQVGDVLFQTSHLLQIKPEQSNTFLNIGLSPLFRRSDIHGVGCFPTNHAVQNARFANDGRPRVHTRATLHPPPLLSLAPLAPPSLSARHVRFLRGWLVGWSSRAVAAKTIRLLDGVGDAAAYQASGVRVLHLVRDPRAVVRSQLGQHDWKAFKSVLPNFQELQGMSSWSRRKTETGRSLGR